MSRSDRQLAGTIGAEHDIGAPERERQREACRRLSAAVDRQWLVAPFPRIAVWAVMDARAVEVGEPIDGRKIVHHPRREQEGASEIAAAITAADREAAIGTASGDHLGAAEFHGGIVRELFAREMKKGDRCDAVAREHAMNTFGFSVAWHAGVADEDASAATTQDQRGAEAGWPAAYDQAVVAGRRTFGHAEGFQGCESRMDEVPDSLTSSTCLKRRRSFSICWLGASPNIAAINAPDFPAGGS